jgi:hypothetical protein
MPPPGGHGGGGGDSMQGIPLDDVSKVSSYVFFLKISSGLGGLKILLILALMSFAALFPSQLHAA